MKLFWAFLSLIAMTYGQNNSQALLASYGKATGGGSSFLHSRVLTIDHTKVPSNQTNFPVMWRSGTGTVNTAATAVTLATGDQFPTWLDAIDIAGTTYAFTYVSATTGTLGSSAGTQTGATYSSTPYLKTTGNGGLLTNSSGFDAGFYSDSGCTTKLDWEQVTWSAITGAAEYHFREGTLSSSVDTIAYLCYDNSSITTDQSNKTGVWDTNYLAVYHLPNGSTLTATDSTSNGKNGSLVNTPTAAAGQIDGAASFAAASSQAISIGASSGFGLSTAITVSLWAKTATGGSSVKALAFEKGANTSSLTIVFNSGCGVFYCVGFRDGSNTLVTSVGSSVGADGNWHQIVFSADNSGSGTFYMDGSSVATTATFSASNTLAGLTSDIATIGALGTSGYWNGSIDEVRISNVVRTANWVTSGWNNQNAPLTFGALGAQL